MGTHSPESMARLQIDIPAELKTQLKLASVRADTTMSEIVVAALQQYLSQETKTH